MHIIGKWFRSLKIVTKIIILSLVSFVCIIYIGFVGMKSVRDSHNLMDGIIKNDISQLTTLQDIKEGFLGIQTKVISFIGSDEEKKAVLKEEINQLDDTIQVNLNKYKSSPGSMVNDTQAFEEAYNNFSKTKDEFISLNNEPMNNESINKSNNETQPDSTDPGSKMRDSMKNLQDSGTAVITELNTIIKYHQDNMDDIYNSSSEINRDIAARLVIPILISLVLSVLLSLIIIRSIVIPVKKVTRRLTEISESNGDLTQRIGYDSNDEIGQLSKKFDSFIGKLQAIIKEIAISAESISASSQQVSGATSDTNVALEQISMAVNEIAGGTAENASFVKEITNNISEAAKFSESTALISRKTSEYSLKVRELAEDGNIRVNEIVASIQKIAGSSQEVNNLIKELGVSMEKIGEIVNLITNVADQTNLLALNAAIEAARAGEAGKGFNVVAVEIRKLAEESNNAAKKIIMLADDNKNKASEAIKSVLKVEEAVSEGVQKGVSAVNSIDSIIDNIKEVSNQIKEIDNATKYQADTMEGMTKSMRNIEEITQDVAATIEQISASIEEQTSTMEEVETASSNLADMAGKLDNLTSGFKI